MKTEIDYLKASGEQVFSAVGSAELCSTRRSYAAKLSPYSKSSASLRAVASTNLRSHAAFVVGLALARPLLAAARRAHRLDRDAHADPASAVAAVNREEEALRLAHRHRRQRRLENRLGEQRHRKRVEANGVQVLHDVAHVFPFASAPEAEQCAATDVPRRSSGSTRRAQRGTPLSWSLYVAVISLFLSLLAGGLALCLRSRRPVQLSAVEGFVVNVVAGLGAAGIGVCGVRFHHALHV